MAGSGKETPRQKMVGMMYLVLTALLALQVSNSVLEKFLFIDDSLQEAVRSAREDNEKIIRGMEKSVAESGNRTQDVLVVKKAKQVIAYADEVLEEIYNLRKEVVEITGGKEEDGTYKGGKSYDEVMTLMLGAGDAKNGKGYALKAMLNEYSKKIADLDTGLRVKPLAQDAWDMELFKNNADQKNKDFAHLNFEQTPMVAALAIFSQMQTEVVRAETKALELLASKVGMADIKFDQISAMVSPSALEIPAGMEYTAKMFIGASSSAHKPSMSSTQGSVSVDSKGIGELKFVADADQFDATGRAEKVWKGSISIKHNGRDTTFTVDQKYTVVQPTIQIQSASVQALYYNCGNDLSVISPTLAGHFKPDFELEGGGSVEKTDAFGKVRILPKAKEVRLIVKQSGRKIGDQKFRVRSAPLPTIAIFGDTKKIDGKNSIKCPRSLALKAVPEADFANFLPADAQYQIRKAKVTLARGKRTIGVPKEMSGTNLNISDFAEKAKEGDRLLIEIEDVVRKNYKGELEKVSLTEVFYNIALD
jgi:gliding motility-associated protein GldM